MVSNPGSKRVSSLPFPAIVGQTGLKRVLLAVAINDDLDGALVTGEKGTAKSTAVRALVDLLPSQRVVADCQYGCSPDDPGFQCGDCRERDSADLPVDTRPVPLVTLPLGATRDRVAGTLSVENALAGEAEFDPGLLARAHRGVLYVDEVNLLDDHLVDVILDAAASGVNTVERDGVSVSHPASFTLIGTMNPEEGDLRPQLTDRFALQASVEGCRDIEDRVTIIDRALGGGEDGTQSADGAGSGPALDHAEEVDRLRGAVDAARTRLSAVELSAEFKREIARFCLAAGVDGHRGDIAVARTARTLAALDGRSTVVESDVHEAVTYALPHRLRSTPFEETPDLEELLDDHFDGADTDAGDDEPAGDTEGDEAGDTEGDEAGDSAASSAEPEGRDGGDGSGRPPERDSTADAPRSDETNEDPTGNESGPGGPDRGTEREPASAATVGAGDSDERNSDEHDEPADGDRDESPDEDADDETAPPIVPGQHRAEIGEARAPDIDPDGFDDRGDAGGTGSRPAAQPNVDNRGARVRTEPASGNGSIDAAASVRSAARRGGSQVESDDLRRSVRAGEASVTIVFAVDASASMRPAMRVAKGVVLDLLRESYQRRDQVAFVAFAGEEADVLLPPTDSVTLAARHLKDLPSGDRTPLPAGIDESRRVVDRADSDAAVVVVVTDGRANVADGSPTDATRRAARTLAADDTRVVVVDAGDDSQAGLCELLAAESGGERVSLSALSTGTVHTAAEEAVSER